MSRHRVTIALLVVLPLAVGAAAGVVLDGLTDRQRVARDARLTITQLHETVQLQETLVTHAMVMDHLTADLPDRLGELRAAGEQQLDAHLALVPTSSTTASLQGAWATYLASVDRRMERLGAASHEPSMGADGAAMGGQGVTGAATGDGMGEHNMAAPRDAAAGEETHAESSSPEASRLLGIIDGIDRTLRREIARASELGRRGSIATVALAAVILAAVFWQVAKSRRATALAEADRRSEARFRSLVQNASDVIVVVWRDTTVVYHTPSAERMLGTGNGNDDGDGLRGTRLGELVHPDERERFASFVAAMSVSDGHGDPAAFRLAARGGGWVDVEVVTSNLLDDPSVGGLVLTARDVSERKVLEDQLVHQAFHDALTGLANRKLFVDRVTHALQRRLRSEAAVSVLFCDLDDFKVVNDTLGHAPGDQVLSVVGRRLAQALRAGDSAARLGGDEFAVLLEDSGLDAAKAIAERVLTEIRRPIDVDGEEVRVDASIGIATQRAGHLTADELLRDADLAMYLAKGAGKGQILAFEPQMHDLIHDRIQLKADLQGAAERGELRVQYQPSIVLSSGAVSGLEALVRWQHPQRGLIPPTQFIPLAEETGAIHAIGGWILARACADVRTWQREGGRDQLCISVNVSTKQLQRDDIITQVDHALRSSGLDPASLTLEITETAVLDNDDALVDRLNALKALGVRLAVDDFGTGYSSLSYLRRLPVDVVKVDRSFISPLDDAGSGRALVATIIELARALDLQTVAEGVEQTDQVEILRELGCEVAQGFLFARPLDPEHVLDAIRSTTLTPGGIDRPHPSRNDRSRDAAVAPK